VTDASLAEAGRAATRMGAVAGVSRLLGGVRVLMIAGVLGTTALGDTFQSSNSVSNVLFELLAAGALSAVLVPTFVELLDTGDRRALEEVSGRVVGLALAALAVVAAAGVALAPQVASLLTASVDDPATAADQQALATTLLRFFIPQVLLYAVGTVATALLYAQGRFALAAAAPIGNTVVLVSAMLAFRAVAGPEPGLDLSGGEEVLLGLGGTLGVAAFVGVPTVGAWLGGVALRPRLRGAWADARVRRLLRLSGWGAVQHAGAGLLLGAALVVGAGVTGGVVAYQVAYVVFLTPFGVLAQPIMTTVLPVLSRHATDGDLDGLGRAAGWALDALAAVTLPVSAACVALSVPIMTVLAFGRATAGEGVELLAAALAALAVGLFPYGAFLLLARCWYALGDSRSPALAATCSSLVGVAVMVAVGPQADGAARMIVLGGAHSLTFGLAAAWLALRLRGAVGSLAARAAARSAVLSVVAGVVAWALATAWGPEGRTATVVALAVVTVVAGGVYLAGLHLTGGLPGRTPAVRGAA
jgi:putative peptidoglycan lipid II flippase